MTATRVNELDGLRGIAAIVVALFHFFPRYDQVYGHAFEIPSWTTLGYFGVHLFFLVSGFVIFWTISRAKRPFDFIWSRFSRLYPVFWAAVCITFIAVSIFGPADREVSFRDFLLNLSMIHQYFDVPHVDGVYWTLTLELTFYGWMLMLFMFNQIHQIEKWLLGWIILAALVSNNIFEFDIPSRVKFLFLLDFIALFAAGISFYLIQTGKAKGLTYCVLAASVMSLFVQYSNGEAALLCAIYATFYLAISGRLGFLGYKPFVFMGTISYSFYLIHQNIGYMIINHFYANDWSPLVAIAVSFVVAFLLGVLLTFSIEKPAMTYLRSYYKNNDYIQKTATKLSFFLLGNIRQQNKKPAL